MNQSKNSGDWLRQLVAYLGQGLDADGLATAPVPAQWTAGRLKSACAGSLNQSRSCRSRAPPTGDPWWIDFCLQRYQKEFKVGHEEAETLTGSHAWQHLTAHAAIRYALRANKPLIRQVGKDELSRLCAANDTWWGNEAWLMQRFYSYAAKSCVSVGARDKVPGWPRSSQKDAFAAWIVGAAKKFPLPRNLDGTDIQCQVWGSKLVALGDDLGRSKQAEPKLWSPVYVLRQGDDVHSYWNPAPIIIGPAYYAEAVAGKTDYKYEPTTPENAAAYSEIGAGGGVQPAEPPPPTPRN